MVCLFQKTKTDFINLYKKNPFLEVTLRAKETLRRFLESPFLLNLQERLGDLLKEFSIKANSLNNMALSTLA